ncbi:MAG: restriction endonuclease subunit S [Veillonellales bacterium]
MKRYPRYKTSGVEWIGDIPEEWEVRKISRSFDVIGSGTTPKSDDLSYYDSGNIYWVNTGDLNDGTLDDCEKKITEKAFKLHSALKIYPKGTLLIAMYGATIGKVSLLNIEAATNQACCALFKSKYFLQKFIYYWFLANKTHIINLSYGGGQPNISQDIIRQLRVQTPSLTEQATIADFLDHQAALIDKFITGKRKQIDLLKELRTAVINKAVTKGLDPYAKMKPSGVEWIGDIPEEWEVRKISRSFDVIGSGTTPKSDDLSYYDSGNINWVNTGDLNDGTLDDCEKKITEKAFKLHSALKIYPKGTLLIAMYGATIGKVSLLNIEAATNQACCALFKSKYFLQKFIYYWFLANKTHIINLSFGGGQPNISQDIIRQLRVQTPSLTEQTAIVKCLDQQNTQIDSIISRIISQITLMQEYRTSLITAAVTGKIDVRGWKGATSHES